MSIETPEQAYNQLLILLDTVKNIEEEMKTHFDYSPFSYLHGKIRSEIRDIRGKLISYTVEKYRKQYTPNLKPNMDFNKKMTDALGDLGYEAYLIAAWFDAKAQDKEQLRILSLKQIIKTARYFLPYTSDGQPHGPLKDWRKIISGNILILRCYSWGAYNSISYHLNADGQINALEKIIDLVTLRAGDPATIDGGSWISKHIKQTRQEPEQFYGKHSANHPMVQAFQFFKNDKLKIWFKQPVHAQDVARTLVNEELPERRPSLLEAQAK